MLSLDEQVVNRVCEWLAQGEVCWFCTIAETFGSSPRPVGSLFAVNAKGETVGSLSGGCIEEDLVERLVGKRRDDGHNQLLEYGVSARENERLGLPCGGRLRVLLETLGPGDAAHFHELRQALHQRRYIERRAPLTGDSRSLVPVARFAPLVLKDDELVHTFGPRYRLLLVGAGALSKTLAELAVAMEYHVVVCDPRPELLQQWDGPQVQLVGGMPDDAVRAHATDPESIVLTLTHDPRIDDMALMEALRHELFYVGALGSERTSRKRRERLLQLDLTSEQLSRLHAPVGLAIGSKTPMEIAIAVLAQLTQLRAAARMSPQAEACARQP